MKNAQIKDNSKDRNYFAVVPYYIVNHSTAYEQSLYLIMKRRAGEQKNGTCFVSLNNLAKNMGVHKTTASKTITKLLKRGWIKEIEPVIIKGGKVRQFEIIDLWELNMKLYGSGAQMTTSQGGAVVDGSGAVVDGSGAQSDTKKKQEEELLRRNDVCFQLKDWNERQTSPIIGFKPENIVNKYGAEKIEAKIKEWGQENQGFSRFLADLKDNK